MTPASAERERVWIAFDIDRGARYNRVQFTHVPLMEDMAIWLPMLVADAMVCNFGEMPKEARKLLREISKFAADKLRRSRRAKNQTDFDALRMASRKREWNPTELSDNAFNVVCEVDMSAELERIKVMTPFAPPEAAMPEECRELIWLAYDWVADGSGLHPGRALMAADYLTMYAAMVQEYPELPGWHDRGIVPWILMEQLGFIVDGDFA